MRIDCIRSVVALRTNSSAQETVACKRIALAGLICHLSRCIVDVNESAVEICKAHGHGGAGKMSWSIIRPGRWPIVVAGVQPHPIFQLHFCARHPIAPGNTMMPL